MLPIYTNAEDVKALIAYLKNKATGATTSEIRSALEGNLMDPRKITAYLTWQFIEKSGDKFRLAERGRRCARKPAEGPSVFKEVVDSIVPYRAVLEWAFHQAMVEISNVDVASHWHEHQADDVGTDNENTLKDAAVCFFNVCQAAELGKLVMGRRGQPTRLQLNASQLQTLVEAGPSAVPASSEIATPQGTNGAGILSEDTENLLRGTSVPNAMTSLSSSLKIFITHGKNMTLVDQVQTMLSLGGLESEVAEDEETTAIPVPEKVFSAMRRCQAGIIIVSAEEASKHPESGFTVNQNVLIEIGAAFVLYDRRVVLVWDKRLAIPSNLQGLYRCEFEGEEFSWSAGMKLMKAVKDFRH